MVVGANNNAYISGGFRGEPLLILDGQQGSIRNTAFSPDGNILASVSYNISIGNKKKDKNDGNGLTQGLFDIYGNTATSKGGEVILWGIKSKEIITSVPIPTLIAPPSLFGEEFNCNNQWGRNNAKPQENPDFLDQTGSYYSVNAWIIDPKTNREHCYSQNITESTIREAIISIFTPQEVKAPGLVDKVVEKCLRVASNPPMIERDQMVSLECCTGDIYYCEWNIEKNTIPFPRYLPPTPNISPTAPPTAAIPTATQPVSP